jgi:hypothetical protein
MSDFTVIPVKGGMIGDPPTVEAILIDFYARV